MKQSPQNRRPHRKFRFGAFEIAFATAIAAAAPFAVAVAAEPASASAEQPQVQSVLTMQVDGLLTIDPDGKLVEYRVETPLSDKIRDMLERQTGAWTFQPVLVNGKPVKAKTRMRVTLRAEQQGENYRIEVDNVTFPGNLEGAVQPDVTAPVQIVAKSMRPPVYPRGLESNGVEGIVLVYLKVGADGKVEEAAAAQSSLLDVRGRDDILAEVVEILEKNTLNQARRWRFDVKAPPDGTAAQDMTVAVPVYYKLRGKPEVKPGMWRTEVRGARKEIAWLRDAPNAQKIGVSDLGDSEIVRIASAFKLRTPAVGAVL